MYSSNISTTMTTDRLLGDDYLKVDAVYKDLGNIQDVLTHMPIILESNTNFNETGFDAEASAAVKVLAPYAEDMAKLVDEIDVITVVSSNIDNVLTVGDNIQSVVTTAQSVNSVNTVAANVQKVVTVADNVTNVQEVADNMVDVTTVSQDIVSVNAVAENIDDLSHVIVTDLRFTPNNELEIDFKDQHSIITEPLQFNHEDKSTIMSALNKVPTTQTIGITKIGATDRYGVSFFCGQDLSEISEEHGVVDLSQHPLTVDDEYGAYLFYHSTELTQFLAIKHEKDGALVNPEDWSVSDSMSSGAIPKGSVINSIQYENITKDSDLSPFYKITISYSLNSTSYVVSYRSTNPVTTAVGLADYVEDRAKTAEANAKAACLSNTGGTVMADNPEVNVFTKKHNEGTAIFRVGNYSANHGHAYMLYEAGPDILTFGTYDPFTREEKVIFTSGFTSDTVNFVKNVTQNEKDMATQEYVATNYLSKEGGTIEGDSPTVSIVSKNNTTGTAKLEVGQANGKSGYIDYNAQSDVFTIGTQDTAADDKHPMFTSGYKSDYVNCTKQLKQNEVDLVDVNELKAKLDELTLAIDAKIASATPIGTIVARFSWTAPDDTWVRCTGGALDEDKYPEYVSVMGTTSIPDLDRYNGLFLRMASSNGEMRSIKRDAMQRITGTFGNGEMNVYGEWDGAFKTGSGDDVFFSRASLTGTDSGYGRNNYFDSGRVVRTDDETYPSHMNVCYFIKVKH